MVDFTEKKSLIQDIFHTKIFETMRFLLIGKKVKKQKLRLFKLVYSSVVMFFFQKNFFFLNLHCVIEPP